MASQSNRMKWLLSGALVGALFGLWLILAVHAHPVNFVLAVLFGGYMGHGFAQKSPRERRDFIALWLAVGVLHQLFYRVLNPISLPTANCCGTGTSDKFETNIFAWALTVCAIVIGSALWGRLTKKDRLRENY